MLMKLCLMAHEETYLLQGGPAMGGPARCHHVSGKPLETQRGLSQGKKYRETGSEGLMSTWISLSPLGRAVPTQQRVQAVFGQGVKHGGICYNTTAAGLVLGSRAPCCCASQQGPSGHFGLWAVCRQGYGDGAGWPPLLQVPISALRSLGIG